MKKRILRLFTILFALYVILPANVVLAADESGIEWQKETFVGAPAYTLIENEGKLYAGTAGGGVYVSSGGEWFAINNGLNDRALFVLSLAADSGGILYAGTWDGVYRLDGNRWVAMNDGIDEESQYVNAIFEYSGTLYAGTSGGIYRYNGERWNPTTVSLDTYAFAKYKDALYAGTFGGGLFRFDGENWTASIAATDGFFFMQTDVD